jgi:hypothetical protein
MKGEYAKTAQHREKQSNHTAHHAFSCLDAAIAF